MVFHFHPRGFVSGRDEFLIYMGRDKVENEELIRYGLPVDVWFHVDNLSSAHVYLRLPDGVKMEEIPAETLEDCAQLVKQNSIQGARSLSRSPLLRVNNKSHQQFEHQRQCSTFSTLDFNMLSI
jgi:predicted ribosome quality control (RQC) complex YloA/Tae2 family protein